MLIVSQKSSSPGLIFLAARMLFLATASPGPFIISLVEDKPPARNLTVVEIIALRLDSLLISLLAGTKMSREAMTDLLKFTYNILAHYPKVRFASRIDLPCPNVPRSSWTVQRSPTLARAKAR